MIDLKTLQIGDLLKHINGTICHVSKIEEGRGFACKPVNDKISQHLWSYNNEFEPIPITEEMLKSNNWNVDGYSTNKIDDNKWLEYYHHEHRLRIWWQGVDEWQNHAEIKEIIFQCHCTYIHELQHALKLCGLIELANTIKLKE